MKNKINKSKNFGRKKNWGYTSLAIFGVLLLFISFYLDEDINALFTGISLGFLDSVLYLFTNFIFVAAAVLVIPAVILYKKNKKSVRLMWVSFASSIIISVVLKVVFARPRPIPFTPFMPLAAWDYSFPSMHSMSVFAVLPFITDNYKFSKLFVLYAMMVAFSRVYFSYHYLSDVVFGMFFGYFLGSAIYRHSAKWKPEAENLR